jgi:hypothetical protein
MFVRLAAEKLATRLTRGIAITWGNSLPFYHVAQYSKSGGSGVAGDWRRVFSREAAALFDDLAGDWLIRLGYETDRRWVDRYDDSGVGPADNQRQASCGKPTPDTSGRLPAFFEDRAR